MFSADCTVLVTSCDAYRDVEGPFIALWRKFWPDCPFETVLLAETERPASAGAPSFDRTIATGPGKTWCQILADALSRIGTPYVMMVMNDYFLEAPVNTQLVLKRLSEAKMFDAANVRLEPNPPGRVPWPGSDLMEFPKNTAYCVTCQTGIWNREYLAGLAARYKSAWEFERFGSFMLADEKRPLLVSPRREFPFLDAVHKGYWEPWGVRVMAENCVEYAFSRRGEPPLSVRLREGVKKLVFAIFPWTLIVRVQNALGVGMKERRRSAKG